MIEMKLNENLIGMAIGVAMMVAGAFLLVTFVIELVK
jgi:hypothetical protein